MIKRIKDAIRYDELIETDQGDRDTFSEEYQKSDGKGRTNRNNLIHENCMNGKVNRKVVLESTFSLIIRPTTPFYCPK